jgi:hypothetical protein
MKKDPELPEPPMGSWFVAGTLLAVVLLLWGLVSLVFWLRS